MTLRLLILAILVNLCVSTKLPSIFKKCNRKQPDFNSCLPKSVEHAIRQLNKPIKEVGLPNLEPLEIPLLMIGQGTKAVAFAQLYKNLKIFGFSDIQCSKFELDFAKKRAVMECFYPQVRMDFQYEIKGKILLLPIHGSGPGTITISKLKSSYTFDMEEYEKKNKKFFKVVSTKLKMQPELIHFQLENLFDGDKRLGDNILKVLNENWKDVYADVQPSYEEAYAQIFASVFNNLLNKVSIDELFGEE